MTETEIDPRVTKSDAEYLVMSPEQRFKRMIRAGHARPEERSNEQVIQWFESLGEVGIERLRLAQELNSK